MISTEVWKNGLIVPADSLYKDYKSLVSNPAALEKILGFAYDVLSGYVNISSPDEITHAYELAERKTIKDTNQALESLVHNLCSMQCFPGYEDLWVYDLAFDQWCIYTFEELHYMFVPGRFFALSVNPQTGAVEMKPILDCVARYNDKKMIAISDASGVGYVSTFDHRYMTSNQDLTLGYTPAATATHTTMPRNFQIPTLNRDIGVDVSEFSARGVRVNTPCIGHTFVPYTVELAELLGYWVADGWVSPEESMIGFAVDVKVPVERLLYLFKAAFGFEPVYRIRYRDGEEPKRLHSLMISAGVHLGRCITMLAGHRANTKHVPNFVLTGSVEFQNAFIRAYIVCDGGHHRNFLDFSTVSAALVHDMRLICMSRGEMLHVGVKTDGVTPLGNAAQHLYTCMIGKQAAERMGFGDLIRDDTAFEIPKYDNTDVTAYCKLQGIPWGNAPDRVTRREKAEAFGGGRQMYYSEIDELAAAHAGRPGMENLHIRSRVFNMPIVEKFEVPDEDIVYDISVADNENFILSNGAIVHNSRAGSQTPFSSVNFGIDRTWEGRAVSNALLDAIDAGLGLGETAIFPIAIFKLKKGITDKGSPNYDLYKKAIKVSSKRMYPNFLSLDASFNLPFYQEDKPETHAAAMGAVYHGMVTIKLIDDQGFWEDTFDMDISRVGELLMQYPWAIKGECKYIDFDPETRYFNVDDKHVKIYDSIRKGWVGIRKYMVFENKKKNWREVTFNGIDDPGFEVKMKFTEDHPLPMFIGSLDEPITEASFVRTPVEELKIGDKIPRALCEGCDDFKLLEVTAIRKCKRRHTGYDFETNSDRFDVGNIISKNCRTRSINNHFDPEHQITEGRGNLFWTTINLPMLALDATHELPKNPDPIGTFFNKLDEMMDNVRDFSLDRFEIIAKRRAKNFPFSMGQHEYCTSEMLKSPEDEIREVLKQGTLSIGFIGLAETLIALTGTHHAESEEAQKLGLEIVKHMKEKCDGYSRDLHLNFSLMATPAEGCTGRLQKLIRKKYGVIKGITDKEYLVNSFHVPNTYHISVWDKINIEAPYHKYCLAGAISYIELDTDAAKNLRAMEQIIDRMAESDMGYFALNHPLTRDPICGYVGPMRPDGTCPRCGRKEFEGVPASKLLSLSSYTPDPEYAITAPKIEDKDKTFNSI